MASIGEPVTALLQLDASGFEEGIKTSTSALTKFANSFKKLNESKPAIAVAQLTDALYSLESSLKMVDGINTKSLATFSKLANAINTMANGLNKLQSSSLNAEQSINTMDKIFKSFQGTLQNTTVKVEGVTNVVRQLTGQFGVTKARSQETRLSFDEMSNAMLKLAGHISVYGEGLHRTSIAQDQVRATTQMLKKEYGLSGEKLVQVREQLLQSIVVTQQYAQSLNMPIVNMNKLEAELQQLALGVEKFNAISNQNYQASTRIAMSDKELAMRKQELTQKYGLYTSAMERNKSAMNSSVNATNKLSSASSRLGKVLGSVKSMGMLVGSMFAWNFSQNLLVATNETIQAKSEMEGYFKMLNFGQSDIDHFNNALDRTVSRFQRVNKYSLGETISSIGVEFKLSTSEMEKAMSVTSMITSEYLRAGRNANEASLAVKDVLQGQFQRLSRETGVKGEQLKEAGWSGDTNDVLGLMEALEKVGHDRGWDVFAEKANSLNDIVTILQNRFGEWSADMVYSVQPMIVGTFNAIMDVGSMLGSAIKGIWNALTNNPILSTIAKVSALFFAIKNVTLAMVSWRTGAGLAQMAQLGLRNSIIATILGLEAETVAENGLSKAIAMKNTGLTAEKVAYLSSRDAIFAKILGLDMEKVAENGLVNTINASIIAKEAQTIATVEQTGANLGFTGALSAVIAGETIAEGTTLTLAESIGVLTGVMMTNPIVLFAEALLALGAAFYVATGGLSDHWDKMKSFNDTMENSDSIVQQHNEYLNQLANTVGKDSQEYKDAKDSIDDFNESLGHSKALVKKFKDDLANVDIKLDVNIKEGLRASGLSSDQIDELSEVLGGLDEGYNTYYKALQVMHKQENDTISETEELTKTMEERNASSEDLEDKLSQYKQHKSNFIKHSAEHNTSDDWWSGTWSGILATVDAAQLGLDFLTEDLADWWHDLNTSWDDISKGITKGLGSIDLGKILGGIGDSWNDWVNDAQKSLSDSWKDLTDMWENNISKPFEDLMSGLGDWWNSLDIGKYLTNFDLIGMILDWIFPQDVSASDGSTDHPSFMEDVSAILGFDIQSWIDSFLSDPLGTLGIDISGLNLSSLLSIIFGGGSEDSEDSSWASSWWNNNVMLPIQNAIGLFLADPVGVLGDMVMDGLSFINSLLPPIDVATIWSYVDTNIIQPFGQAIWSGILNIPILGDILQLLGYTDQASGTSSQKGTNIANSFGNALQTVIGNIPILGDLLRLLGVIDSQKPTAQSKGQSFGDSIHKGVTGAISSISNGVKQEFQDAINGIGALGQQAYNTAKGWADQLWQGVNSILQRHSPGFFHDQFKAEFGTDVPNAIQSSGETAYAVAQGYAQNIKQGIADSGTTTIGMDTMVSDYQNDAQTIATSSQMMGINTTDAFNQMQTSVNSTTNQMQGNVTSSYNTMRSKQQLALNSMKSQNLSAYNEMYLKSNQSLIQMRDSTSNVTNQMINAWNHMKNQIVASANKLKSDSTAHFNSLSSTIGSFYRKIQNPSNWGAGSPSLGRTTSRRSPSVGTRVARRIGSSKHGAGVSPYSNNDKVMSIRELLSMTEMTGSTRVDMNMFLASLVGEHGLGWGDWNGNHFNHIKNKSNQWQMKAPMIMGYISAGNGYKVGEFANGKPNLTWDSFMDTAEAVFSNIDYDFYFDSNKYGNWVNALRHGETNCSDGSDALIALAQTFGFDGYKQHTTLGSGVGHFYAIINGQAMDTTHFQHGGGWSPLGGAGIPTRSGSSYRGSGVSPSNNTTVNVTITGDVYGIEDLDSKIHESVRKGLREEFNDPYGVAL